MCAFELCDGLRGKLFIEDLPLSRLLLNGSKYLPWVLLVPRVDGAAQLTDLDLDDQLVLLKEINTVGRVMQNLFECDRLNIAAIGNKTPQLHIHIICRAKSDPYWPETVWQYKYEKMTNVEASERAEKIQSGLKRCQIL